MCIAKKDLEKKVQELRSLKTMKEEIENELKAIDSIIEYMTEHKIGTEYTSDATITYKPQNRTTLDKDKLAEILGDDLKPFEKTTSFNVFKGKVTDNRLSTAGSGTDGSIYSKVRFLMRPFSIGH